MRGFRFEHTMGRKRAGSELLGARPLRGARGLGVGMRPNYEVQSTCGTLAMRRVQDTNCKACCEVRSACGNGL